MVIGVFKSLRESWTDTELKIELKHTYQRIDETPKRSHTNSLVSKPHSRTVYGTVGLHIYVKVLYVETITGFLYI